jgi:hypothetical protein
VESLHPAFISTRPSPDPTAAVAPLSGMNSTDVQVSQLVPISNPFSYIQKTMSKKQQIRHNGAIVTGRAEV